MYTFHIVVVVALISAFPQVQEKLIPNSMLPSKEAAAVTVLLVFPLRSTGGFSVMLMI